MNSRVRVAGRHLVKHFIPFLIIILLVGCENVTKTGEGGHSQYRDIEVEMWVEGVPVVSETFDVTCQYVIGDPYGEGNVREWIVDGYFWSVPQSWEFVAGDSSWVDTTMTGQTVKHRITLRALYAGEHGLDVRVTAPFGVPDDSYILGVGAILIQVDSE